MAPILNEVSISLKDKIQVVKIDTEKYTSIADKYSIQALPTFIIFKDGEPCDRFVSQNGLLLYENEILFPYVYCDCNITLVFIQSYNLPDFTTFQEGALPADQLMERIENALKVSQQFLMVSEHLYELSASYSEHNQLKDAIFFCFGNYDPIISVPLFNLMRWGMPM